MRWFKHDCDMSLDLKIQSLIARHGLEGYAIWNLTLELLGREGKAGLITEALDWRSALLRSTGWDGSKTSRDKLDKILDLMSELELINPKSFAKNNLYIPKFKERSDDYTRRVFRESSDNVRTISEQTSDNVHVDKKRIDKIRTEYTRLKGWDSKDLVSSDYARIVKAAKALLIRAEGDADLVVAGLGWLKGSKLNYWTLETLNKLWADFKVSREKGKGAMDRSIN